MGKAAYPVDGVRKSIFTQVGKYVVVNLELGKFC